ncbi:hypothetical protein IFM89_010875 [Coptis chinensis]|uniref:Uncharacterized protein n=1 Tax=Coptis chinensis TaxID=261450 RepID=A0A835I418_9MAGN|nr:hypothetical protein IFM89_010875 [Coptis chinensis]
MANAIPILFGCNSLGLAASVGSIILHGVGHCRRSERDETKDHFQSPHSVPGPKNGMLYKILKLKEDEPESVLRELTAGCSRRRSQYSSIAQFNIHLISLIQKDMGEEDFRGWIDKQKERLVKRGKEAKLKVLAARDKERRLKQHIMQDDVAKEIISRNGAPLSISEHESLISRIKDEAAKARAEKLEAIELVPKLGHECKPLVRIYGFYITSCQSFLLTSRDSSSHDISNDCIRTNVKS